MNRKGVDTPTGFTARLTCKNLARTDVGLGTCTCDQGERALACCE